MLKSRMNDDLKTAMVAGEKDLVEVLRSLKSAILYKEVEENKREDGLADEEVLAVLKKEKKSRVDSMNMYSEAGEAERAEKEKFQIEVIEQYLPEQLTEEQTKALLLEAVKELSIESPEMKNMGQIMSEMKKANPVVEGSVVSKLIKELSK